MTGLISFINLARSAGVLAGGFRRRPAASSKTRTGTVLQPAAGDGCATGRWQPRAETDGEPFAEIERPEQHLFHPIKSRLHGRRHADLTRQMGEVLDGHKLELNR